MLHPVIEEREALPFKFWFNDRLQDGLYYRNELFYRLHTVVLEYRSRLYHYACKMALHDAVLVTAADQHCSIWVSLHSPQEAALLRRNQPLPSYIVPPIDRHKADRTTKPKPIAAVSGAPPRRQRTRR